MPLDVLTKAKYDKCFMTVTDRRYFPTNIFNNEKSFRQN